MKNYQLKIISLIAISILISFLMSVSISQATNVIDTMKAGLTNVGLPGGGNPEQKATDIVGGIINAFLSIFGTIFLILMIFGGYKWMVASGREEEVKKAKDTIRAAIIGLIIVISAYAISYFVVLSLQTAAG